MEVAEGGASASLAWRLLATLEGVSLSLAAAAALLAYRARTRGRTHKRQRRRLRNILLTNTTSELGSELKRKLEERACTVSTLTSEVDSQAGAGQQAGEMVDALVIVGKEMTVSDLDGMVDLVAEEVYGNLKFLYSCVSRVRARGVVCVCRAAPASPAAPADPYRGARAALDDVVRAGLAHAAKAGCCEAVWVTGAGAECAARCVAALLPPAPDTATASGGHTQRASSLRTAAAKVSHYIGRWLKIVS